MLGSWVAPAPAGWSPAFPAGEEDAAMDEAVDEAPDEKDWGMWLVLFQQELWKRDWTWEALSSLISGYAWRIIIYDLPREVDLEI